LLRHIRERRPAQVPRRGALPPAERSRPSSRARQRLAEQGRARDTLLTTWSLWHCGGIDAPENMQWQSAAEAKAKDKWERNDYELPVAIPRVALAPPSISQGVAQNIRCMRNILERRRSAGSGSPGAWERNQFREGKIPCVAVM
jgi:hypothetical protein